jgi:hypothetical protein
VNGSTGPPPSVEGGAADEMIEIRFWDQQHQQAAHRDPPPAPSPSMQEHLLLQNLNSSGGASGPHPRSGSLDSLGSQSGLGDYWCGIRIESIQFSISVAICYGASLGGMSTLTGPW